ncbi:hypothetical protein EWM64_g4552, partial [Hericium alpestre]
MSAGARQSAIDALREDEDVIIIEKSRWFRNLHSTIHHAATRKNFEDYLYDPLMEIFGTFAKTCNHENLAVTVIPQGCFELRTDFSARVSRKLTDILVAIHSIANPDDPQYSKSRLGGWVEGKPWHQSPKSKKKEEITDAEKDPGTGGDNVIAEELADFAIDVEKIAEEGKFIAEEGDYIAEEEGYIAVEGEGIAEDGGHVREDIDVNEEDIAEEDRVKAGEDPATSIGGPSIEDASALTLDSSKVIQRLVEDLRQLCQQAYFAFEHFDADVLHAILTYGMTFSCFKFIRPADWDSIRGNKDGIVSAPEPVYSNERMVFEDYINPHLLEALHLMTASMGMSYQPSWFQLPPGYCDNDSEPPDLTVAETAIERYRDKHGEKTDIRGKINNMHGLNEANDIQGSLHGTTASDETNDTDGSPHGSTSSEESEPTPNWKPTAKEAAAP